MNKNKKLQKNSPFSLRDIIVLFIVFLFPIFLSLIYIFLTGNNFSTPEYAYQQVIFSQIKYRELLAGDKLQGEFAAHDNNLGIVAVGFNIFNRINTDVIIFKIKEKNQKDWLYKTTYNSKEFGGYPFFPFGFPIINDSKNKSYILSWNLPMENQGMQ